MDSKKSGFRSKAKWVVIGLVLLSASALLLRTSRAKPNHLATAEGPVKADPRVIAEGMVLPHRYSTLSLPASGLVGELLVHEGEVVKEGQTILRLVADGYNERVAAAHAELMRAQARRSEARAGSRREEINIKRAAADRAQAAYQMAVAEEERAEKLFAQQALSRQEYEKTKTSILVSKSDLEEAKADLALVMAGSRREAIRAADAEAWSASANYQQIRSLAVQTELKAPFSGTITLLDRQLGEYAASGTPLARLGDLSKWIIQTDDLTELQISRVREGAKVTISFDALEGVNLEGKVISIRAFGEKKRGDITYTVTIEPNRFEPQLKWNMTATVHIETQ